MNSSKSSQLLAILKAVNPLLGSKKWNLTGVSERTQQRWFVEEDDDPSTPSMVAVKAVAQNLWSQIQCNQQLRREVFARIRVVVPTVPCDSWNEFSFIDWFVSLVDGDAGGSPLSVELDVEVWTPARGFVSLREPGVALVERNSRVRVRALAKPPAYLHLIWIDSHGAATPLHPWTPKEWTAITAYEAKDVDPLPVGMPGYWEIDTPAGLESVVVAASHQPINLDTLRALKDIWGGLEARLPTGNLIPGVPFEWQGQPGTFRLNINPKGRDPMQRRNLTVAERLSLVFPYVKILSFINRG